LKCTPAETEDRHIEQAALTVFFDGRQARRQRYGNVCRRILRKAKPSDAGIVAADGVGLIKCEVASRIAQVSGR
jgi:hypothetical protein